MWQKPNGEESFTLHGEPPFARCAGTYQKEYKNCSFISSQKYPVFLERDRDEL